MNRFLSQKFRFYSFVSIALLLFVHGYNLKDGYLQPFSLVREPLTFTTYIEYFLANGALRFRIPLLFLISGYIFAMQDEKPYWERIKKRFSSLMIPFFIWSAVGLAITYLWQQFPVTAQAVKDSQLDQLGDNRPYSQIGWGGVLFRWAVTPISFQLWFIRTLFIYNLIYPLLKWLVLKFPLIWFSVMFFAWLTIANIFLIEGQGIFFFTLGVWLSKRNYPIEKKPVWFSHYISWLFFIGVSIIKTFMAFELSEESPYTVWILSALHVTSVASGILAIWFGADPIVKWCMEKKWFVWMSAFSFVIFGLHVPLIEYVSKLMFIYLGSFPYYRLLTYALAPLSVFVFCIVVGALLRAGLPRVYRVATGGRGF